MYLGEFFVMKSSPKYMSPRSDGVPARGLDRGSLRAISSPRNQLICKDLPYRTRQLGVPYVPWTGQNGYACQSNPATP